MYILYDIDYGIDLPNIPSLCKLCCQKCRGIAIIIIYTYKTLTVGNLFMFVSHVVIFICTHIPHKIGCFIICVLNRVVVKYYCFLLSHAFIHAHLYNL